MSSVTPSPPLQPSMSPVSTLSHSPHRSAPLPLSKRSAQGSNSPTALPSSTAHPCTQGAVPVFTAPPPSETLASDPTPVKRTTTPPTPDDKGDATEPQVPGAGPHIADEPRPPKKRKAAAPVHGNKRNHVRFGDDGNAVPAATPAPKNWQGPFRDNLTKVCHKI